MSIGTPPLEATAVRLTCVRFTLRRTMVAVAVVAVNLGLIRGAEDLAAHNSSFYSLFVLLPAYALVPSLSLLTVAAMRVGLGLVKQGHAPPFPTGYLLLGSLVTFGVCLALATHVFMLFTVSVIEPEQSRSPMTEKFLDILTIMILSEPQIAIALIGGGLAARYGLTIVLGGRVRPAGEAMAATSGE